MVTSAAVTLSARPALISKRLLAQALEIPRWLRNQPVSSSSELHKQDREIAQSFGASSASTPLQQVLVWWQQQHQPVSELTHKLLSGRRWCSLIMLLAGALLGISVTAAALAYTGDHPVNLVSLLALLVVLPGLMLIATLALLPLSAGKRSSVTLPSLNPGRIAMGWLQRWVSADAGLFQSMSTVDGAHFAKWQSLLWSQLMAVSYFVGVIATCLAMVTFSDLAFGWSTTLDVAADKVAGWVQTLSLPWAQWFPGAMPSSELVHGSRFFRLDAGTNAVEQLPVSRLGDWWPFVLMTIILYGFVPRVALLLLAGFKLNGAAKRLLINDSEVVRLLQRLNTPVLDLGPQQLQQAEVAPDLPALAGQPGYQVAPVVAGDVLIWNEAIVENLHVHFKIDAGVVIELGSTDGAEEQRQALTQLTGSLPVFVITKGWEPPLLEFLDMLSLVRAQVGEGLLINVVPINVAKNAIDPNDALVWQQSLRNAGDPRVLLWNLTG